MSAFVSSFCLDNHPEDEGCWLLQAPLIYSSDLIGRVEVPAGFCTDLASVPRLPVVFMLWGARAHREGVIHDYLYRQNSKPLVTFSVANKVFLEAMVARGKPWWIRWPMYLGVCAGGLSSYHKKRT